MSQVSRQWFDRFVAETRSQLTAHLRHLLSSPDDALEVSQEAYLKVYCVLRTRSEVEHAPKALLYTTARNLAISRLRHQKVAYKSAQALIVNQELRARSTTAEQDASKHESFVSLLAVINSLPPKCRTVMLLRIKEGLSQKEIAQRLGIAVSTVEKHLAKGLHLCRIAMRERTGDETSVNGEVESVKAGTA